MRTAPRFGAFVAAASRDGAVGMRLEADPGGAGAGVEVKVELVTGEKDAQNLGVHTDAQVAWGAVAAKGEGI